MSDFQMDARQYAPATQRNKTFILQVLQQVLPSSGTVLEIASGTGEHAVFFAQHLAPRLWIPSDVDPLAHESINAWRVHHSSEYSIDNLAEAIALDVSSSRWPIEYPQDTDAYPDSLRSFDLNAHPICAIVNINMIHISPWSACCHLMTGAQRLLPSGGVLYLYGPFKQGGFHTASSNAAFDQRLRSQNPEWGIRDLDDVINEASQNGLLHHSTINMPANNLSIVLQRR